MHGEPVRFSPTRDASVQFDETPPAFGVQTRGGSPRMVVGGQPAFVIRVPDESAWERLQRVSAYRAATAFVRGEFDIEGDFMAALRWWYGRPTGLAASSVLNAIRHLHL